MDPRGRGPIDPQLPEAVTQTAWSSPDDLPQPGTRITITLGHRFGRYRSLRLLGEGGMGEVYEAEDEENGRHVALKALRKLSPGRVDRARFLREGRLAASISHPNVVYVFGTDEIDGVPVIATEIATGGTLRDRVKSGRPFTPGQAVDAILQVIAGLEAAAQVGVLHRDIKPSNCFIDGEGRVKIGDFGLAISTDTFDRADITVPGTGLGTPAYASPEQMRGQAVDVRSDIYSVGATLHWLLVGRAPFGQPDTGRTSAQASTSTSTPFVDSPRDVPRGLKRIALQCLETAPDDRPQSYPELRRLLQPYRSSSSSTATLGLRALAASLDLLLLDSFLRPFRVFMLMWIGLPGTRLELLLELLSVSALWIPYFGLTEGVWSGSLGKRLLGLRVVGVDLQPVMLKQSFTRTALWWAFWAIPGLLVMTMVAPELLERRSLTSQSVAVYGAIGAAVSVFSMLLLFVTARRRNGFAGLHDFMTRTRVVSTAAVDDPIVSPRPVRSDVSAGSGRIGPYVVLPGSVGAGGTIVAFDERLARRVWIRELPLGTPPLPPERRDLGRPARLHWLNGRRGADANWDAFEAVAGEPLLMASSRSHSWSIVRHWLLNLAQEIAAMSTDKTEVSLSTAAVWVDGTRARLLDWACVDVQVDVKENADWQRFLCDVALIGLDLDLRNSRAIAGSDLPLHARQLVDDLAAGRFKTPSESVQRLSACMSLPAALTRARRGAHLAACGGFPALAVFLGMTLQPIVGSLRVQTAEFYELQNCLNRLDELDRAETTPDTLRERTAIEVYMVGRFRGTFVRAPGERKPWFLPLLTSQQVFFQRALERHASPSDADVQHAAHQIATLRASAQPPPALLRWSTMPFFALMFFAPVAALSMLSAFAAKGGAILRGLGLAIVGPDGREVSRVRALFRATIAWSPIFAGLALNNVPPAHPLEKSLAVLSAMAVLLLVFIAGAAFAYLRPERGVQDHLAGTQVVAR